MAEGTRLNPDDPLVIRAGDAQSLLNYLGGQPCAQVYGLVTMLMNLAPLVDLTKTEAPAEDAKPAPEKGNGAVPPEADLPLE